MESQQAKSPVWLLPHLLSLRFLDFLIAFSIYLKRSSPF